MRKKYWLILLIVLAIALSGCGKKRYVAPPPEPGAPFDLTATVISSEQIDLAWKHISQNEEDFYVYRKSNGSYSKIASLDPETLSYSDSPLDPETTYWYKVTAYGEGGESSSSNEVSATTPPECEMLGYSWDEYFSEYSQKWSTSITGEVKNNSSRILTILVKGKFWNYDDVLVATRDVYLENVEPGKSQSFYFGYYGERIEQVEAWIEDYY